LRVVRCCFRAGGRGSVAAPASRRVLASGLFSFGFLVEREGGRFRSRSAGPRLGASAPASAVRRLEPIGTGFEAGRLKCSPRARWTRLCWDVRAPPCRERRGRGRRTGRLPRERQRWVSMILPQVHLRNSENVCDGVSCPRRFRRSSTMS
jgi:hypothetical protein